MIVQIYEVQSTEEAAALVKVGVDHVGVLVGVKNEWPGEFNPEKANNILSGVQKEAKRVVLSLSKNIADVIEIIEQTDFDILHLAAEPEQILPSDLEAIKSRFPNLKVMRTIPVVGIESIELAKQYVGIADYLLLDTRRQADGQLGATGETHDWNLSKTIIQSVAIPTILAGGLGPNNVMKAILQVKPFGVDSKTKTDKDGSRNKDLKKVAQFVKIAKSL